MLMRLAVAAVILTTPLAAAAQIPEPPGGVAWALVSFTQAEVTLKNDNGSIVVVPMTSGTAARRD